MADSLYLINSTLSIERFDAEIVAIDIAAGVYFSVRGAAADILEAFREPFATEVMIASYCQQVKGADITSIREAVTQLVGNSLIVPSTGTENAVPRDFANSVYSVPSVEVFTDLAELIALDPVHEVDAEAGWPVRPPSFPDVA